MIINVGASRETKKLRAKGIDRHVSGVPVLGGIHFLIGGLISPCKWLALLCILDYIVIGSVYLHFNPDAYKLNEENAADKEQEEQ